MKPLLVTVYLVLFSIQSSAQDENFFQKIIGTWTTDYDDKTFIVLTYNKPYHKLTPLVLEVESFNLFHTSDYLHGTYEMLLVKSDSKEIESTLSGEWFYPLDGLGIYLFDTFSQYREKKIIRLGNYNLNTTKVNLTKINNITEKFFSYSEYAPLSCSFVKYHAVRNIFLNEVSKN